MFIVTQTKCVKWLRIILGIFCMITEHYQLTDCQDWLYHITFLSYKQSIKYYINNV